MDDSLQTVLDWLWSTDPLAEPEVAQRARMLLLDTLGCVVSGLAKPEPAQLATLMGELSPGRVRLPGCDVALAPGAAASLAGVAACWDEACEGLARAHGRPGLHAVATLLGLAPARAATLGDALRALVTGYEVGGRLGEVLRIRPGMHVDGTWAMLGSVAAAARLLGSDARQAHAAISLAACQMPFSLYLPVAQGATARNAYVGHGAAAAIELAMASAAGLTSPTGALDEIRTRMLGREGPAALAAPTEWLTLQGYFKPFAAVRHVHYAAACAQAWQGDAHAIRALRLSIYQEALTYCANRAPRTAIQAQFSLSYGLAWTLVHGDLGPEAYGPGALDDPEVRRLEALVAIEPDEERTAAGRRGATLWVDGARFDCDAVKGDADLPFTVADVRAKFLRYASRLPGSERVARGVLEGPASRPLDEVLTG